MKRCPACGAALPDSAVSCDLCYYSFARVAQTVQIPAAPPQPPQPAPDPRVEEYTAQYQQANIASAVVFSIGMLNAVYSIFFPSLFVLTLSAVFILLFFATLGWKTYLRTRIIELGYARADVDAWEKPLKKHDMATTLLAFAVTLLLLAFLAPMWYEQFKERVVFIPYTWR